MTLPEPIDWLIEDRPLPHGATRAVDPGAFRAVLARFCSGITVVAAQVSGQPVGFTCQSFFSVSLDPPLVAFCVSLTSTSYPRIRSAPAFCINVLSSRQREHSRTLSSKAPDKWSRVAWTPGADGAVHVEGALARIDCAPWGEYACGDHRIVVGRVLHLEADGPGEPLLYFDSRYRVLDPVPPED